VLRELALDVAIEFGLGIEGLGRAAAARTELIAVDIAMEWCGCWVSALPRQSKSCPSCLQTGIAACWRNVEQGALPCVAESGVGGEGREGCAKSRQQTGVCEKDKVYVGKINTGSGVERVE